MREWLIMRIPVVGVLSPRHCSVPERAGRRATGFRTTRPRRPGGARRRERNHSGSARKQFGHRPRTDARRQDAPLHGHRGQPGDQRRGGEAVWQHLLCRLHAGRRDRSAHAAGHLPLQRRPGSASMWLHMGSVGPVRVVTSSPAATAAAPYQMVPNQYSLLDKTRPGVHRCAGHGFFPTGRQSHHPRLRRHRSGRAGLSQVHRTLCDA